MEGLSLLLNKVGSEDTIDPPTTKNGLQISHILYADDILSFAKANEKNARAICNILKDFADLSGLQMLNIKIEVLPTTYLGLPLFSEKLTKSLCSPLVNKFKWKLESWKSKLLSLAGRVELIISTLSNLTIFWSAAFPLPCSTFKELENYCRDFL